LQTVGRLLLWTDRPAEASTISIHGPCQHASKIARLAIILSEIVNSPTIRRVYGGRGNLLLNVRTRWNSALEYEFQRFTRHCATTGREIKPGETFYSTLVMEGARIVRQDFAADAWRGPPQGVLGWWKSQVPTESSRKIHWAPNDVMLELLEQWESDPAKLDSRYVLSLLLIRRRVLRLEETERNEAGQEVAVLYCPRRETTYRVITSVPDDQRAAEIQNELGRLLFAGGAK
jgi:hypothetical protein